MKYFIDGNTPIDPILGGCWKVLDENGWVLATCYGPASMAVAHAACEKLNSDYEWDGRCERMQALERS